MADNVESGEPKLSKKELNKLAKKAKKLEYSAEKGNAQQQKHLDDLKKGAVKPATEQQVSTE